MGNNIASFEKCEEAIFLKSTKSVIDVNAQGAFAMCLVAKTSDSMACGGQSAIRPSSLRLYSHKDEGKWVGCTKKLWAKLAKYARDHQTVKSDDCDKEDEKNTQDCSQFIFDANKIHEHRDKFKTEDGLAQEATVLISMVVTTVNIDGWVDSQKESSSKVKAVKVTQQEIITDDMTRWIFYTRMYARPGGSGMLSSGKPQIGMHDALIQIDTRDDMHFAIGGCNAVMVNGQTGEIREGSFKKGTETRENLVSLIKDGARGKDTLGEIRGFLDALCDKTSTHTSTMASGNHKDRFVALVGEHKQCGAAKVSVQVFSSLNEEIQEKITTCKTELPSNVGLGSRTTDKRGSCFKRAASVWLAAVDFNGAHDSLSISVTRYE